MALETNLVSYWKMDETSGTRSDSKGSNDLTASGVDYDTGQFNNAADFNDLSDYLTIADGSQSGLDGSLDFSFSLWVNWRGVSSSGDNQFIAKHSSPFHSTSPNYDLAARLTSGRLILSSTMTGGSTASLTGGFWTFSTDTWHHIVVTRANSGNLTLYLNNVLYFQTASGGGTSHDSDRPFYIGNRYNPTPSEGADALIDEVGFWSRELTTDEVEELHNSGSGLQFDNEKPGEFDDIPPICWNYTAQYKGSTKMFKMSGPGDFPKRISIPGNIDTSTGKMIDDGQEIDPSNYEVE